MGSVTHIARAAAALLCALLLVCAAHLLALRAGEPTQKHGRAVPAEITAHALRVGDGHRSVEVDRDLDDDDVTEREVVE
jgi:hypothetical protein